MPLDPLRSLVGGARVVFLGEATHGDGATVHAISRIARYLHEELGFEVFALESGLYDCGVAWRRAQGGASADEIADTCAFVNWRETEPSRQLWEYVASQVDAESHRLEPEWRTGAGTAARVLHARRREIKYAHRQE